MAAMVNVTNNVFPSFYRPFGDLPTDMDLSDGTAVSSVFGAACSGTAVCFLVLFAVLVFLILHLEHLRHEFNQRPVIALILGSCFTTAMGFVSVADAITQYPDGQSPYGHALERLSIIGILGFFLPALFFRPFAERIDTETEPFKTKLVVAASGFGILILISFTIASLCLKSIPFGLLLANTIIQVIFVGIVFLIGAWILVSSSRDQFDGVKYDNDKGYWSDEYGNRHTPAFEIGKRLLFLGWGTLSSLVAVALSAVESPMPLYLRGGQVVVYFIQLFTIGLFAWSLARTLLFNLKQAGTTKPTEIQKTIDRWSAIKIESGQTSSSMQPLLKEGPNVAQTTKMRLVGSIGNE